jgi:membrane-anchored protein YejM (alkaline phosphatase superfamily)
MATFGIYFNMQISRRRLFRWMGWFAMANAIVLGLVGLRYFSGFMAGDSALVWTYLLTVYFAHHVMVAVLPLFILLTPMVLMWPNRKWVTTTAALVFAILIAVILLDSLLWSQSRFHLNALTISILGWQSGLFFVLIFAISLFFEVMLAARCWAWVELKPRRSGILLAWIAVFSIVISQGIHVWADAAYYVPVTSVGQQLPVYKGFTAKQQLSRWGWVDPQKSRERELARRLSQDLSSVADRVLKYPLNPLQCRKSSGMNILLIMADAMRSDRFNEQDSPRLHAYAAKRGQVFEQHYSGGNSSRMGMFSLLYGLPPGYWSSFESLQRSSVLIDELQHQNYQLGLFSSASMYRPVALDRTAFANVPDLRRHAEGETAWKRDSAITAEWFEWLSVYQMEGNPEQPFFGFLFYDSTNVIVSPPDYSVHFDVEGDAPLAKKFSEYRTSVHFVDSLIGTVLDDLDRRGLADDTVVIISSDHGEEFDDSGAGLKIHGSGYTRYQLQVPMIITIPGKKPSVYRHRSSHYDLVPTLMRDVLGCSNPPADFSSGRNLFSGTDWDWLLAGSYYNYAVLEPDQITVTYPNGSFEVRDWSYKISTNPQVRGNVLEQVSKENSRFYRQ